MREKLETLPLATLRDMAKAQGLKGVSGFRKSQLIDMLCETAERMEAIRSTGRIFFTVGNLEYLQAGGRIGRVAGIAGSLLGIRPVITMKEGEIFPSGISRSRKKTLDKTIDLLKEFLQKCGGTVKKYSLAAGFGYDREEAEEYRKLVVERLDGQISLEELPMYQIGATIGVHTGPYPLGLGILERA